MTTDNNSGELFCPECFMDLQAGAVICTNCGYNTQTGQRVATQVEEAEPRKPGGGKPARPARPRPKATPRKPTNRFVGIPNDYEEAAKLIRWAAVAGVVASASLIALSIGGLAGLKRWNLTEGGLILLLTIGMYFLKNRGCAVALLLYFVGARIVSLSTDRAMILPSVIGLLAFSKFFWDGVRGTTTYARLEGSLLTSVVTGLAFVLLTVSGVGGYLFHSAYEADRLSKIRFREQRIAELKAILDSGFDGGDPTKLSNIEFQIVVLRQEVELLKKQN